MNKTGYFVVFAALLLSVGGVLTVFQGINGSDNDDMTLGTSGTFHHSERIYLVINQPFDVTVTGIPGPGFLQGGNSVSPSTSYSWMSSQKINENTFRFVGKPTALGDFRVVIGDRANLNIHFDGRAVINFTVVMEASEIPPVEPDPEPPQILIPSVWDHLLEAFMTPGFWVVCLGMFFGVAVMIRLTVNKRR